MTANKEHIEFADEYRSVYSDEALLGMAEEAEAHGMTESAAKLRALVKQRRENGMSV